MLAPRFVTSSRLLDPLSPLISTIYGRQSRGRKVGYAGKSPFGIELKAPDGFTYSIFHDNVVIGFDYADGGVMETDDSGLPRLVLPAPRTFNALVSMVLEDLNALLDLAGNDMKARRFGLVATIPLRQEMPPGVKRFLANLDQTPGHGKTIQATCALYAELGPPDGDQHQQAQQAMDRCHYNVRLRNETTDGEPAKERVLALDYQRYFDPGFKLDAPGPKREIQTFVECAMRHFHQFGSGL